MEYILRGTTNNTNSKLGEARLNLKYVYLIGASILLLFELSGNFWLIRISKIVKTIALGLHLLTQSDEYYYLRTDRMCIAYSIILLWSTTTLILATLILLLTIEYQNDQVERIFQNNTTAQP